MEFVGSWVFGAVDKGLSCFCVWHLKISFLRQVNECFQNIKYTQFFLSIFYRFFIQQISYGFQFIDNVDFRAATVSSLFVICSHINIALLLDFYFQDFVNKWQIKIYVFMLILCNIFINQWNFCLQISFNMTHLTIVLYVGFFLFIKSDFLKLKTI